MLKAIVSHFAQEMFIIKKLAVQITEYKKYQSSSEY